MRINTNVAALNSYNQLNNTNSNLSKSLERLSSGKRINRAADDAAGLAISEKMLAQTRGLAQSQRNAQDGISMIQTAEGALKESHSILQRMRELSVQAANDSNTDSDRAEIQEEIEQLTSELDRIGNNTEFNTKKLLNGNISSQSRRAALDNVTDNASGTSDILADSLNIDSSTDKLEAGSYTLKTITDAKEMNGFEDVNTSQSVGVDDITVESDTDLGAGQYFVDVAADITGNITTDTTSGALESGVSTDTNLADSDTDLQDGNYSVSFDSGANEATLTYTNSSGTQSTSTATYAAGSGGTQDLSFASSGDITDTVTMSIDETAVSDGNTIAIDRSTEFSAELNDASGTAIGSGVVVNGGDEEVLIGSGSSSVSVDFADTIQAGEANFGIKSTGQSSAILEDTSGVNVAETFISPDSKRVDLGDTGLSFSTDTSIDGGEEIAFDITTSIEESSLTFQIGANNGQNLELGINDMRANSLEVDGVDVSTQEDAEDAIDTIDKAISEVSSERSKLGAVQNRLDHTINNLSTSEENLTAAESRISDVDMAKEMMNMSKNQILSQAGTAMLAQANQLPQGVLQLLG